jgi:integrase
VATIRDCNGVWQAQIRKHGHHVPSKTFTKKSDADAWARKVESEIERGVFLDLTEAQQTSIAGALGRYAREILPSKRAIESERSRIKRLSNRLGSDTLASINPRIISSYRNERLAVAAPQTVKHEISLLSRVFNVATRDWGINLPHGNPVAHVSMPKLPSGRTRRLESDEESLVLKELATNRVMHAVVVLALETAMRRSEIARFGLK